MSEIAVIIPMHNFGELTTACIDATLENSGVPVDIHVVDDASDIPFVDNRVTVHRLDNNLGFTGATNHGILKCWTKYKYIHFLNNDTIPRKDFIKLLLDELKKEPDIGIACSARETDMNGETLLETFPIDLAMGWAAHQALDEEIEHSNYNCPWVPICSALVPVEVIYNVGLLDRRMKNHCSDNDFCVRAGELGYRTVLVFKSVVKHIHEVTTKSVNANITADQIILMGKVRCDYRKSLLDNFPLDGGTKLKGELIFMLHGGGK
jgi:hypothetical protein